MNFFLVFCFIFLLFIGIYSFKDIISPPIVLCITWLLPIAFVWFTELFQLEKYSFNFYSLIFVIGVILFYLGFYMQNKKMARNDYQLNLNKKLIPTKIYYIFILLEIIIFLIFLKGVNQYVFSNYKYNYWFTYKWGTELGYFKELSIMPIMRVVSRVAVCTMLTVLLNNRCKQNLFIFLIQLIMTALYCCFGQGRGGIFSFVIPLFILYLILNRKNLKKTLKTLFVLSVIIIVIFSIYSYLKAPYKSSNENFLFSTLENYLGGSLVAFCNWADSYRELTMGTHTFQFFCKLLSLIGIKVPVANLVQPYVENIHGNIGNVYTIYHWYMSDFGCVYAVIIQFFLGNFHGFLYRKMYLKKDYFYTILNSMFYYPLVLQFFMDEYTTMISLWMQCVLFIYLFTNTKIFFKGDDKL